jgi:hypothetical protein
MRLPRRADTALAHEVYPRQQSNNPGDLPQSRRSVPRQTDVTEDHEVDDAEVVEMLQAVLARKLREFSE